MRRVLLMLVLFAAVLSVVGCGSDHKKHKPSEAETFSDHVRSKE